MRLPELLRTTAVRWALACAASFALGVLLFAALIYHETVGYLLHRVNAELHAAALGIARGGLADQIDDVSEYVDDDPQQLTVAGLFDQNGRRLSGNLRTLPAGLAPDHVIEIWIPGSDIMSSAISSGTPRGTADARPARRHRRVHLLLEPLPGGRRLVVGVGGGVVHQLENLVSRALWVSLPPMLLLALATGFIVSRGALRRISQVHQSSRRIMAGQLHERLPTRGTRDAFDQLAHIVNTMLNEIERLLLETKGVGEGIAHDLRTPLTRLRARLERALNAAGTQAESAAPLAAGIEDIDQILGTINALLRIAEVEHGARRAAFALVELRPILADAIELYEPMAEDKTIRIVADLTASPSVLGDRDLLFEAVANLIDNAIKFSAPGGRIEVALREARQGALVQIADSGPGIAPEDWERVTRRFFRKDPSRQTPGSGLGLSLVAAITRLHGFGLTLDGTRSGCCIELECWSHEAVNASVSEAGTPLRPAAGAAPSTAVLPVPLRVRT